MSTPKMSIAEIDRFMQGEHFEYYREGGFTIECADGKIARVKQRYNSNMLRPGGTISGPTLMSMADLTMYVALLSGIGPAALAVTINLNINFLRKASAGHDLLAEARLLKLGTRLAIGEVHMFSDGTPDPVAHVTTTYSIPPASFLGR